MATLGGLKGVLTGRYTTSSGLSSLSGVKDVLQNISTTAGVKDVLSNTTTAKTDATTQMSSTLDWIGQQVDNLTVAAKNSSEAAKTTATTSGISGIVSSTGVQLAVLLIAGAIAYRAIK